MASYRAISKLFQHQKQSDLIFSVNRASIGRNVALPLRKLHSANDFQSRSLISSIDTTYQSYICDVGDRRNHQSKRYMVMITNTKSTDDVNASVVNTIGKVASEAISIDEGSSINFHSSNEEFSNIKITNSCWKRIQQLAMKKNQSLEEIYLRVYVDAGGCSGFTYKFEISGEEIDDNEDIIYTHNDSNSRVVIDQTSFDLLKGSSIDYVQEMIKSNFSVASNPQSESACGCGSSFALKNFQSNTAAH